MGAINENALTTASNMQYVRAVSTSGESIRISKADLATVMAELIPVATTTENGLMPASHRGRSFTSGDGNVKWIRFAKIPDGGMYAASAFAATYANTAPLCYNIAVGHSTPLSVTASKNVDGSEFEGRPLFAYKKIGVFIELYARCRIFSTRPISERSWLFQDVDISLEEISTPTEYTVI
ncbi:MAG: hypothetical protein ACRC3Z_11250 [Phocaeicola sp.]